MEKIGKRAIRQINGRKRILEDRLAKAAKKGPDAIYEATKHRLEEVEYLIAVIGIPEDVETTKQN